MGVQIYHIAKQYRTQRGNQFYKDRSNRFEGTFCGSTDITYMARWNWKIGPWVTESGQEMVPCEECLRLRNAFKAARRSA